MPELRDGLPYIWATWLPRLLTGENSCEWATWFRAVHASSSWTKRPSDFDSSQWLLNHTALLNRERERLRDQGYEVFTEGENSFYLEGKAAIISGKADLVAIRGDEAVVVDAKTGKRGPSHAVQVMLYEYALPRSVERCRGLTLRGEIAYTDGNVPVPGYGPEFVQRLGTLVARIASESGAARVPSYSECRFCDITAADCPVRVEERTGGRGVTEDF